MSVTIIASESAHQPAAQVDENAVLAFLSSHGPDGPTDTLETSWSTEIDGWGEPGSADFAHSFETFLYALQHHGQGLILGDGIGNGATTPILMDVSTDSGGVSNCFLVRVCLPGGAEICVSDALHHLASGTEEQAVLDAVATVAGMVNAAYQSFLRSVAMVGRNQPDATPLQAARPVHKPA